MKKQLGGYVILSCLALVAQVVSANPAQIMLDCQLKNKVYTNNLEYVLNKSTPQQIPQVYFLKNKSKHMLILDHVEKDAGAKAGWSSGLAPGKWSALAVSQTGFSVRCTIAKQDKYYPGSCEKLISVCQPMTGAVIKSNGNYWVTENKSWPQFWQVVKKKGIVTK